MSQRLFDKQRIYKTAFAFVRVRDHARDKIAFFVDKLFIKANIFALLLKGIAVCVKAVQNDISVVVIAVRDPEPGAAVVGRNVFRRIPVKVLDQRITDIPVCLFQRRKNRVAVFFVKGSCHEAGGPQSHDPAALLFRDPLYLAEDHGADPLVTIAFIHPKRFEQDPRPVKFKCFGYTSADDLTVFVLDFEREFFFVRIHLARHDLIDLFADIYGFFFCKICNFIFHLLFSSKCESRRAAEDIRSSTVKARQRNTKTGQLFFERAGFLNMNFLAMPIPILYGSGRSALSASLSFSLMGIF